MDNIVFESSENFLRGFLKLIPIGVGEGLGDILFAIKDAKAQLAIEDSIDFIAERINDYSIKTLRNQGEIDNKLEGLKDKQEVILKDFLLFLKQKGLIDQAYFEELLSSIDKKLDVQGEKIDNIDTNVSEIKEMLSKMKGPDQEAINKVFNNYINQLLVKSKNLEFNSILKEVKDLEKCNGYKNLDHEIKSKLLAIEGNAHLKLENLDEVKIIVQTIELNEILNEEIVDFLMSYAAIINDDSLKDKLIDKYKELGISEQKIKIQEARYLYSQKDYQSAMELLVKEEDDNIFIRKELLNEKDIYHLVGMIKLAKNDNDKAEAYLKIAYSKNNSTITKFFYLLSTAFKIIARRGAMFVLAREEKRRLESIYNQLSDDEFTGENFQSMKGLAKELWLQRLTILLFIDSKKALDEYEFTLEKLGKSKVLDYLKCDILYLNKKYDVAENELLKIYKENGDKNLLSKILASLFSQNKFDEVINFCEKLVEDDFDDEGVVASLYLNSLAERISEEALMKKVNEFLSKFKNPIYIYKFLGEYYYKKNKIAEAKENYSKMIDKISVDNFLPRILFAEELFDKDLYEEGLRCIIPIIKYDYNAKKLFTYQAVKYGSENDKSLCDEIIKEEIEKDYDFEFWNTAKGELEFGRNRFHTALKYIERSFKKSKSPKDAYKYAYLKLILNDYNFNDAILILENSDEINLVMLAATCYNAIGNHLKSEMLSIKALALNGNEYNEVLYAQFVQLNLFRNPDEKEKVEFDEVNTDCAVSLENDSGQIWVGITSNNEILLSGDGYKFIDTEFYSKRDDKVISLIGTKKNDTIVFNGNQYAIKDIWAIKTRAIRFCLVEYENKAVGEKIITKIEFDPENPLDSMKETLIKGELEEKQLLSTYNLKDQMGIPLNLLAVKKGRNLFDVIIYLLNLSNQPYFAGEVNNYNYKSTNLVLSPSTIIILSILDVLDEVLESLTNCSVTESTYNYFKDLIDQFDEFEKRVSMSIGINNDHVNIMEFDEESHKKRRMEFVKVLESLRKVNRITIESSAEELDENKILISVISKCDFNGLKLAGESNSIYICDDLVVRKARDMVSKNISSTNSISLILTVYSNDVQKLVNLIEKLSLGKYVYCYNIEIIIFILNKILEEYNLIGKETIFDKVINILHNSLSIPLMFKQQIQVIISVLSFLYTRRNTVTADYLIERILHTVNVFIALYNYDEKIIFECIESIPGEEKEKNNYFVRILKKIDSQ